MKKEFIGNEVQTKSEGVKWFVLPEALSIQEITATSLLPPLGVPVAVRAGAPASSWGLCEEARVGEALRPQRLPVSFPEHSP